MTTRIDTYAIDKRVEIKYERIMDEIYMMFHNHPLSFPTSPLTEEELLEINFYVAMGNYYNNQGG